MATVGASKPVKWHQRSHWLHTTLKVTEVGSDETQNQRAANLSLVLATILVWVNQETMASTWVELIGSIIYHAVNDQALAQSPKMRLP